MEDHPGQPAIESLQDALFYMEIFQLTAANLTSVTNQGMAATPASASSTPLLALSAHSRLLPRPLTGAQESCVQLPPLPSDACPLCPSDTCFSRHSSKVSSLLWWPTLRE